MKQQGTFAAPTRHRIRAVVVGLPLVALGALVFGTFLGPVGLVGAVVATVVVAVVIAKDPPAAFEHPGCLVVALSLAGWALTIAVVVGVGWLMNHTTRGSPWCGADARVFAGAPECVGRDMSFLQGRHNFSEATGPANEAICRSEQALAKGNALDPNASQREGQVLPTTCPAGFAAASWVCVEAQRLSGGGDMSRTLYGFSADCANAKVWQSTNVEWSSMPKALENARD